MIPILLLLACDGDTRHTPDRSAAVALSTAVDEYNCPADAGADGYLAAPVPVGRVGVSAWACYPNPVAGGGTFSEGCETLRPTLLVNAAKTGAGDYLYLYCDTGTIRLEWLLLADPEE